MLAPSKLRLPPSAFNEHLTRIEAHFGKLEYAPATIPDHVRFVFLCFTNRCGSNYVSELLASSGQVRRAGENLNYNTVLDLSQQQKLNSFQSFFEFLILRTVTNNIVTIKIAPAHIELLAKSGILDQIIGRSHFIVIERADKLAQAISLLIAVQTGRYTSTMAGNKDTKPEFNPEMISRFITAIAEDYKRFSLFFAYNGIVPAQLIYEQVVQDPQRAMAYAGQAIGLPDLHIVQEKIGISQQRDALNQHWRDLFLSSPVP